MRTVPECRPHPDGGHHEAHNTFDDRHAVRIAPFGDARYAGGMLRASLPAVSRADRLSGGDGD